MLKRNELKYPSGTNTEASDIDLEPPIPTTSVNGGDIDLHPNIISPLKLVPLVELHL
jgi:hypothetical protein